MAKKKPQHGGARKGAGRKVGPQGPATVVAASIPESLAERLDAMAKKEGWTRSAAVAEAIRRLVS